LQSTPQKEENVDAVALDYYLSGVKIDPQHFGCAHNIGYSYFMLKKYLNAQKWFQLAQKLAPTRADACVGHAMASLRLGEYHKAYESAQKAAKNLGSESQKYSQETVWFLEAVCCKLLEKWEEATELMGRIKPLVQV
jgi:tetratricopeptide (TPR) repeat protein